jgi:hypothetical protein
MAYDPALTTAKDRIRFALGDTGSTSLLVPGGEATYAALLALSSDEAAVYRTAAGSLANYYSNQPNSISSSGDSLSWADRAAHWRKIAAGEVPYPFGSDGETIGADVLSFVPVIYRVANPDADEYSR